MMDSLLLYILVLCCCGAISDVFSRHNNKRPLILGGEKVMIQYFPYQVYLSLQGRYYNVRSGCGGSILNKRHALTAAHCVDGMVPIYARVGSYKSDSGGQIVNISTYTMHPQYDRNTYNNDIAIVRFRYSIEIDNKTTRAVTLPESKSDVAPGTYITVTGWGHTSEGGQGSNVLMGVKVPVISRSDCNETYYRKLPIRYNITENMICAGKEEGGMDSCQGDSGGPAVVNGIQHGVVSFGYGCGQPGVPGVYTKVANYRSFIKRISGS